MKKTVLSALCAIALLTAPQAWGAGGNQRYADRARCGCLHPRCGHGRGRRFCDQARRGCGIGRFPMGRACAGDLRRQPARSRVPAAGGPACRAARGTGRTRCGCAHRHRSRHGNGGAHEIAPAWFCTGDRGQGRPRHAAQTEPRGTSAKYRGPSTRPPCANRKSARQKRPRARADKSAPPQGCAAPSSPQ